MSGSSWGPVATPLIAVVGAIIQSLRLPQPRSPRRVVEIFLLWLFVAVIGVGGLVITVSHVFFADFIAGQIGFPSGNPFQWEVGMANLSYTVLGLLCLRYRGTFWYATGIGVSVFYLGDAVGHVYQLVAHNNTAPYNAGPIMVTDFAVPLAILVLLWLYPRMSTSSDTSSEPSQVATRRS